jgi:hypothetical protein
MQKRFSKQTHNPVEIINTNRNQCTIYPTEAGLLLDSFLDRHHLVDFRVRRVLW